MDDKTRVLFTPYRTSLLVCVLFCAFIGVVISSGLYHAYLHTRQDIQSRQIYVSRLISEWIISSFKVNDYLLRDIVGQIDPQTNVYPHPEVEKISRLLVSKMNTVPDAILTGLFDANCILTAANQVAPGLDSSERAYCARLRADPTLETYVTPVIQSVAGPITVAQVRRVASDDSGFQGIATLGVNLDFFSRWLEQVDTRKTGTVAILDSNRLLLARKPRLAGVLGQQIEFPALDQFMRSDQSTVALKARSPLDGVNRFVVFRKVSGLPFIVAVSEEVHQGLAGWYEQLMIELCSLLLLWVLALYTLRVHWQRLGEAELLAQAANTDLLTQLLSRRYFTELAQHEISRARRSGQPLSLMLLDLDRFKQINDSHGHAVGDRALQAFALACRKSLREVDLVARLGGDEFVVLMPETSSEVAYRLAQRVRAAVAKAEVHNEAGAALILSASIGVVSDSGPSVPELDQLLRRADEQLYRAKEQGRNRVISEKGAEPVSGQA